jgi:protein CpxP
MSNTSRNRNLLFIIAALVLTNIAVLVYFLSIKKDDHRPSRSQSGRGLSDILQKEVGFTDAQVAQYKNMKEEQMQKVRPLFDEMRKAKDSLFRLLGDTAASDSLISAAGDRIATRQKMLDMETFNHFRNVRALCSNADQQVKYDSAIVRMFRKMGKPMRRGEGNRKDK